MAPKRLTDKEIFFRHRRARLFSDDNWRTANPKIQKSWQGLNADQRRAEARRLRLAKTADVDWEAIPVVSAKINADDDSSNDDDDSGDENDVFGTANLDVPNNVAATGSTAVHAAGPLNAASAVQEQTEDPTLNETDQERYARLDVQEKIQRKSAAEVPVVLGTEPWVFMAEIGSGSFGFARLFVLRDAARNITERIIVKDSFHLSFEWSNLNFWHGNPRDKDSRRPMEVKAMEMLTGRPENGPRNTVQLLAHLVDLDRMMVRTIMNYCGRGALNSIQEWYSRNNQFIPEPFLWHVFEGLANACVIMKYGNMGTEPIDRREVWEQIVHRDIKPGNIFMDVEHPEAFPSYHNPVLGDFGTCCIVGSNDDLNPLAYACDNGTVGYQAPEQIFRITASNRKPVLDKKLLSHTNIYGIGATMARLMTRDLSPGAPLWQTGNEDYVWLPPVIASQYSQQLCKLVRQCVRFDPKERISARKLKRKIQRYTGGIGSEATAVPDRALGMRNQPPNDLTLPDTMLDPASVAVDTYRIGMARNTPAEDRTLREADDR